MHDDEGLLGEQISGTSGVDIVATTGAGAAASATAGASADDMSRFEPPETVFAGGVLTLGSVLTGLLGASLFVLTVSGIIFIASGSSLFAVFTGVFSLFEVFARHPPGLRLVQTSLISCTICVTL